MRTKHVLFALTLGLGLTLAVLAGLDGNLLHARAATYTVTNINASGPGSLRQAVLDANGNAGHDTIDFSVTGAIVLTDALPAIDDDLTITGPGAEQLAVSGANAYRVFAVNDGATVTITGVTVQDGSATYGGGVFVYQGSATLSGIQVVSNSANSGGGVFVWNGSATLNGVQVANNSASTYGGGGVYVYQGSVTLSGTQMVSNSAAYYGGGVYVDRGSATLGVSGGAIDSNSASAGGGVYVHQGSTTLSETLVIRNSAVYSGGGVYVGQGSATLSGTQVVSNSASPQTHGCGGGVYVEQGSATLDGTQVVSNSASAGGGVYVYQGSATLNVSGGGINDNSARSSGGGVCVYQGSATLDGTQVGNNSADLAAGGGVAVGQGSVTLSGTQVIRNSAAYFGGGISVSSGSATLRGTQVVSNTANGPSPFGYGGGVAVDKGSATLSGGVIGNNSAAQYGGGMEIYEGSATLSGTQVLSNSAEFGGGMYVRYGSATLNETQVLSNSAAQYGGGVFLREISATLSVSGGVINGNSASAYYGGGVYVEYGSATLSGTQMVSNLAHDGGGVFVFYGSATLSNARVLNNSADHGGGLVQAYGSITATNGCIVNNSDVSVGRIGGSTLVATGNWWGAADGPSGVGPGSGDSVGTGVDYSGFLTTAPPGCPTLAPNLIIVKAVTPTVAAPGQTITYTLAFHNAGLRTATGVIITDTIPVSVTHSSLDVDSNVSITATGSISYVWKVVDLAPGAGGSITITGVLSDPLVAGTFANTATVASIEIDVDGADNSSSAWLTLNQAPVANAGSDQDVDTNAIVTLNGGGSSDPDGHLPLTYGWTQTGGPTMALSNPAVANPTFTAPSDPAGLTFTLVVTDSLGLVDPTPDQVVVTVNNQAPIANAGSDQSVDMGTLVSLDGSASSDPDGDLPLTYGWAQTGGPAVMLNNPAIAGPAFIAPGDPAMLTFTLVVTDSLGLVDPTPDQVVVTVKNHRVYLPLAVR
jgi:uncharacterized repeat protein (TIGR01451 family)